MKHQQVVVDYWQMLKTSVLFFLLACSGYVLIKMVQTIFWLPRYLEKNQRRLEELAETYKVNLKEISTDDVIGTTSDQQKTSETESPDEPKKDK